MLLFFTIVIETVIICSKKYYLHKVDAIHMVHKADENIVLKLQSPQLTLLVLSCIPFT